MHTGFNLPILNEGERLLRRPVQNEAGKRVRGYPAGSPGSQQTEGNEKGLHDSLDRPLQSVAANDHHEGI